MELFGCRCCINNSRLGASFLQLHLRAVHSSSALLKNFYEILGVTKECDAKELKAKYLELCKKHHPDMITVKQSDSEREASTKQFQEIQNAYEILSKESDRRSYDSGMNAFNQRYKPPGNMGNTYNMYEQYYRRAQEHQNRSRGHYWDPDDEIRRQQAYGDRRKQWEEEVRTYRRRPRGNPWNDPSERDDEFYGIKGFKRQPNSSVVSLCIGLMLIGALLHTFTYNNMMGSREEEMRRVVIARQAEEARVASRAAMQQDRDRLFEKWSEEQARFEEAHYKKNGTR